MADLSSGDSQPPAVPKTSPLSHAYNYPYATAPDVIRSNQKDVHLQNVLLDNVSNVLRKLYGARLLHRYTAEARVGADLLYFACTTFLGNRTLGEEYCDIVQVETGSSQLPTLARRSSYILSSVLLPYILDRILPSIQARARLRLEKSLNETQTAISSEKQTAPSLSTRMKAYMLENLSTLTSPDPLYAVGLAIFYFSGAYYHLAKRMLGLRYVFTKRVEDSDQRVGYEVLGVLLVLQMAVQSWLHVRETFRAPEELAAAERDAPEQQTAHKIAAVTHTPALPEPRYGLANPATLAWIDGAQQRKCTLCLEPLQDPSATACGHVFCWTCIADWVREKPECPLCRQLVRVQHVLPLRG